MYTPSLNIPSFGSHLFIVTPQTKPTQSNCEISVTLYNHYRSFALALMPLNNQEVYYRVFNNVDNKNVIGYGIHEKFVHHGQSVVDISVGTLDFPWVAADYVKTNETNLNNLVTAVNSETNHVIAGRLRQVIHFIQSLPTYTQIFYYRSSDGVQAVTIVDQPNEVKLNLIISWMV